MNQDNTFTYKYSAKENKELQEIREKYLPREDSQVDELKKLDTMVKRPADVFAYIFGSYHIVWH